MDRKTSVILFFVFAGLACGLVKDWKGIEILWIYQAGFLLTANLMMLEYAWHARHRTKRLFVFPTLGILAMGMLIVSNIAF